MSRHDGKNPQAFPTLSSTNEVAADGTERHIHDHYSNPGMTLRDWFASQALVSCADWNDPKEAARHAYRVADAMMKARKENT